MANLARAQPGVYEDARFVCFEIGAIAAGAAAENRELHCHEVSVLSVRKMKMLNWMAGKNYSRNETKKAKDKKELARKGT
jgi:hypothetical protein